MSGKNSPVTGKTSAGKKASGSANENKQSADITERELRMARALWTRNIEPQMSNFGNIIFRELFLQYPEYEFFFLHMRKPGKGGNDIFTSSQFQSHMNQRVVTKLKEIIDNLDKPEHLETTMKQMGMYHAKLRIRRRHMLDMKSVLLSAVRIVCGNRLQPDEEKALDRCLTKALEISIDVMENHHHHALKTESVGFGETVEVLPGQDQTTPSKPEQTPPRSGSSRSQSIQRNET